jgi:predicted nucleotidyltransferase component of viral defense system
MNFTVFRDRLVAIGYSEDTAYAKIAHDIVLKAVRDSGFQDNLTVKGGVVMSSLTDVARRATMDMDLDFVHYPLANDAIRRFVSGLKRVAPCRIRVSGKIETLRQQEYKGKRIHLTLVDEEGFTIGTKIDIGVHTHDEMAQKEYSFDVVFSKERADLQVKSNEQIFVEKLLSLLRHGIVSRRPKDVFDMYEVIAKPLLVAV